MQNYNISILLNKIKWFVRYHLFVKRNLQARKSDVRIAFGDRKMPDYVLAGPFRGMKYIKEATGSAYLPKILGSYESWLHPWLAELVAAGRNTLHVVGCAEGYYACGLKILNPTINVIAYDINPRAREMCANLALINNVNIVVKSKFDPELLDLDGAIVFMDVEGAETFLLGPEVHGKYLNTIIVLETHDHIFQFGDVTTPIVRTFESSHKMEIITHRDSGFIDPTLAAKLEISPENLALLADELRAAKNNWIKFTPTNTAHA